MRNEKKNKKDSRTQPQNADNNSRDNEKKRTKKQLTPPCNSDRFMVKSSITIESFTCAPHTRSLPERRTKAVRRNMQTTNNNTLTKKGEKIMPDFDNGIFRTIADETRPGSVWLIRVADGERITHCRTQDDVMFCVAELMKQRLGL
jgi:hypothetical protein